MQETQIQTLGQEDPLEKEMATHSSILAWRIPWTEEPGRLQFMGLQRVEWLALWGFTGGSDGKEYACNAEDLGPIPGLGRSPRKGNGYPLQSGVGTERTFTSKDWNVLWSKMSD